MAAAFVDTTDNGHDVIEAIESDKENDTCMVTVESTRMAAMFILRNIEIQRTFQVRKFTLIPWFLYTLEISGHGVHK